jgi:hypothetical protein
MPARLGLPKNESTPAHPVGPGNALPAMNNKRLIAVYDLC